MPKLNVKVIGEKDTPYSRPVDRLDVPEFVWTV